MPYRVRSETSLRQQLLRWTQGGTISDVLLVEIHLRLQLLANNPASLLARVEWPFDGMAYRFSIVDPDNRLCEHIFYFHVVYSIDEETLWVLRGSHIRYTIGG